MYYNYTITFALTILGEVVWREGDIENESEDQSDDEPDDESDDESVDESPNLENIKQVVKEADEILSTSWFLKTLFLHKVGALAHQLLQDTIPLT